MHKKSLIVIYLLSILVVACTNPTHKQEVKDSLTTINADTLTANRKQADLIEIRTLIRNVLKWGDGATHIDLLPAIIKNSLCVGFDLNKANETADQIKQTGFFAEEFLVNYKNIIAELDKKSRNKNYMQWSGDELPPFAFAGDSNPWCSCQDNMSWDGVDVKPITLDSKKGELTWNWGKLDPGTDPSWQAAATKFRVAKEDGKWKIAYLDGFDYNASIQWPTAK